MIRVLIVDDDKLARKGLISIMPWSHHDMTVVGEAANGAKALEFMERQEVDLLFVDLSMPVMSGMELLQIARQRYPHTQTVILSFHEEFENVQSAYRMGVLDYISKVRLESEDDELILSRIQHRMARIPAAPTANPALQLPQESGAAAPGATAPARPEEEWGCLELEWRSLHWLYNDPLFRRLCARTLDCGVSGRRLEGVLLLILAPLEPIAALDLELRPEADEIMSTVAWLRRYRQRVYEQVAASSSYTSTTASILRAVSFIRERASSPLHAEAVADHVHMSRSYFSHCFKKLTGSTFNDFLRQERVDAAERLLCETNRSIGWIANAVGYSDSKYFSQLFQEQTTLLPSEFRAQRQKGEN